MAKKLRSLFSSWLMVCVFLSLTACASVTMRPYGGEKVTTKPSFQVTKTYYWWGLKGEHTIETEKVCDKRRVLQMQSITTLSNWALQVITLGIYAPRTAKVWCEEEK